MFVILQTYMQMDTEKMGEVFVDGRVLNLDNASIEILDSTLEKIDTQKTQLMKRMDTILAEIQK